MLWTEYGPVIKIGPKGALVSHEIRPIHSAPSLGQSIVIGTSVRGLKLSLRMKECGRMSELRMKLVSSLAGPGL